MLGDSALFGSVDRVLAAVGVRVVRSRTPSPQSWTAVAAVVVDEDAARQCVGDGLPRRDGVFLVGAAEPADSTWAVAVDLGVQHVCTLPKQEDELVRRLSEAVEMGSAASLPGRMIAVTAGRGGAGASVFATALAQCAGESLLVDLDACSGGIDLLMGAEATPGLRWPDLRVQGGRLAWTAVREVLPRRRGVSMLSASRDHHEIDAGALAAVVDAGRRGGATVICDVPRQLSAPGVCGLESADLVVGVTSCDVRGIAAAAAWVGLVRRVNPNVGLVVRGPAPGGLRAQEVAEVAGVPLLAAMRPEPMLARQLEQGGVRLRRRSPLAAAAHRVLAVLDHAGGVRAS